MRAQLLQSSSEICVLIFSLPSMSAPSTGKPLTLPELRFILGRVKTPDFAVSIPRLWILVEQPGPEYMFTFLSSYDLKVGIGAIGVNVAEPDDNATALYFMTELSSEAASDSAEPLKVQIQSVCSQNRYLTVTGIEATPGSPLNVLPPEFLPPPPPPPETVPPNYQEYKSDEITITEDPSSPHHFAFSTKLNGTEVFFTTGVDSKGQKIVTAKELSTPPYIFMIEEAPEPTSDSSEQQGPTTCNIL